MKRCAGQMHLLFAMFLVVLKTHELMASSSCNPAILKLYGWCEQWTCNDGCACTAKQDCRQYCDAPTCKDMRCLSPSICKQKVHINGKTEPHVYNMFARAPFVTQDCSGGKCDVIRAKGPRQKSRGKASDQSKRTKHRVNGRQATTKQNETPSAALQNCVAGICQRVISTLEISKQFCTFCTKMHCLGEHARNCTQVCAAGACRQVQCDSKDCQQACLQNASCTMKCGKNSETCLQICEDGSHCNMFCDAKSCRQICGGNKNCERYVNGKRIKIDKQLNQQNSSRNSNSTTLITVLDSTSRSLILNSTSKPSTHVIKTSKPTNSMAFDDHHTEHNTVEDSNKDSINLKSNSKGNGSSELCCNIILLILVLVGSLMCEMSS